MHALARLSKKWRAFKHYPAGERFQTIHQQQADAPAWVKPVVLVGAVVSLAIAVVLTVLPGPAFIFYALAGALAAIESAWIARMLDRSEVAVRKLIARVKRRWTRARRRRTTVIKEDRT